MKKPKPRLKPYKVGDIHTKIGSMVNQWRQTRDLYVDAGSDAPDGEFWASGVDYIYTNFEGVEKTGHDIDAIIWVRTDEENWQELKLNKNVKSPTAGPHRLAIDAHPPKHLPDYFDSRAQRMIVGLVDLDAPSSNSYELVGENRIIIAYPGNMLGLPMDTWVMQEQQGDVLGSDEEYALYSKFLQEHSNLWKSLVNWLPTKWKSIQDEQLELSLEPDGSGGEEWIDSLGAYPASTFTLEDFAPRPKFEPDPGYYDDGEEEVDSNWDQWLWTIVHHPYLASDGTVTRTDETSIVLGEFSSCNIVTSIGGVADRWLGSRPINWYLPYHLVPWTDPWE